MHYLTAAALQAQRTTPTRPRCIRWTGRWSGGGLTRLKRRVDLLHLLGRRRGGGGHAGALAACVDAPLAQTVGLAQGDYFEAVSRYDDALAAVTQARHAAAGAGDRTAEARCLARLGMIRWRQGDHAAQPLSRCARHSPRRGRSRWPPKRTRARLGLVHRQGHDAAGAD
ncbi:MAG: hypothetical protein R2851_18545 [Caldilineaceae bacterium]